MYFIPCTCWFVEKIKFKSPRTVVSIKGKSSDDEAMFNEERLERMDNVKWISLTDWSSLLNKSIDSVVWWSISRSQYFVSYTRDLIHTTVGRTNMTRHGWLYVDFSDSINFGIKQKYRYNHNEITSNWPHHSSPEKYRYKKEED